MQKRIVWNDKNTRNGLIIKSFCFSCSSLVQNGSFLLIVNPKYLSLFKNAIHATLHDDTQSDNFNLSLS